MKYDFLAVGDITTDAFIRIKDATVNCDIDHDKCQICLRFGDKVPFEEMIEVRAVGNAPNAAVSAHRLGLKSTLATNLGDDQVGQGCLNQLAAEGLSREFITVHTGAYSNYHYVLWYEAERTILVKQMKFDMQPIVFDEAPSWFYLSSLGDHTVEYQNALARYIKEKGSKLAFQPGTFQMKVSDQLHEVYQATEIFFCNKEEAQRILKNETDDFKTLLAGIRALGPKIAVVTDGPKGAYASDGVQNLFIPMYPDPAPPVERTGAGDSFASTMTSYLALGASLEDALLHAPVNSASVVQHVGAQKGLLSKEELESWLSKAPADYKITKL